MTHKEAVDYALHRGRVTNSKTGLTGNLVDWMPGKWCKVFTGYDASLAGVVKMPVFQTWAKIETVKESNKVPVSNS